MPAALIVWKAAANRYEQLIGPVMLSDVTTPKIITFEAGLRNAGLSEATIATYLRAIRAAMNWASEAELIRSSPRVRIPKQKGNRKARGRPVTGEEFDRWLKSMQKHVGKQRFPSWERLLRGLWLSGLRLSESLEVWWDRDDKIIPLNVDGRSPVLQIPARLQKSKQDQTVPLTPDFVAFLHETPAKRRTGPVFEPMGLESVVRSPDFVGRQISAAGKLAKIVVARDGESPRYATAHDLRRSFAARWAKRVLPATLMEIMRHEDISTTMQFYVVQSAEQTAEVLRGAVTRAGDMQGDTRNLSTS